MSRLTNTYQPLWIMFLRQILTVCLFLASTHAVMAAVDMDVNTPAIQAIKSSMQNRHQQLIHYYQSGAVGFTAEGFVAVKDASLVPLSQRSALAGLVKDENVDRQNLYVGIAAANGHPEWEGEIQHTFALRWMDKAQSGWFVQKNGQWQRK